MQINTFTVPLNEKGIFDKSFAEKMQNDISRQHSKETFKGKKRKERNFCHSINKSLTIAFSL